MKRRSASANSIEGIAEDADSQAMTAALPHLGPDGDLIPLTPFRLVALTIALLGLQFCWAVQVGNVTKTLLTLGMSPAFVSYAWLAGPIAGIVVQPLVGAWSDKCYTRLGRRRPFLIAGTGITVLCLALFGYAKQAGMYYFGDSNDDAKAGRIIAVASFWALDFALNAAQGPLRALLADIAPKRQHPDGNSYFAFMTGLGNLLGAATSSIELKKYLPFFTQDITALYMIATVVITITVTITVVFTSETALPPREVTDADNEYASIDRNDADDVEASGMVSRLWAAWKSAPEPFHRLFVIQCCTWFGWFAFFVFGTSWVGVAVYNGDPHAVEGSVARNSYEAGVRAGNLGLAIQSIITVSCSLLIPRVLNMFGERNVYLGSHLLLAFSLLSTLWARSEWLAVSLLAATGVPWAITMAIPWSLMGQSVSRSSPGNEGIYFTLFNLSQCFPEIIVSVMSPSILAATHSQAAVISIGGAVVLIGALSIIALGIRDSDKYENLHPLPNSESSGTLYVGPL